MLISRRFRISGRVQGVGFRYATLCQGERLGLAGWVRNLSNGDVETVVCGRADLVDDFERWLGHGPRHARVKTVRSWEADAPGYQDFRILPDDHDR